MLYRERQERSRYLKRLNNAEYRDALEAAYLAVQADIGGRALQNRLYARTVEQARNHGVKPNDLNFYIIDRERGIRNGTMG